MSLKKGKNADLKQLNLHENVFDYNVKDLIFY